MTFLEGLNDAQKRAVLATEGPLLIVAGAGAGKTKTLVHRICHLISGGIAPTEILAVTFTNKAAKEMRERVEELIEHIPFVQRSVGMPFVSTFHSLGVYILRTFGAFDQSVKRFTILDEGDALSLIKESVVYLGLDPKVHDPRTIRGTISNARNARQSAFDLEGESNPHYRIAGKVWQEYDRLKHAQKSLDFDDILTQTLTLLEKDTRVRTWAHETWRYIHIDEYQDTNEVQYQLAKLLAGPEKNICVVGDADQSIYSWRGATVKNILGFERDYPEATIVLLEENYRSTKTVLAAAHEVIVKNNFRVPKELYTNNAHGESISLYGAYDERDEGNFVVERAIEHIDGGTLPQDIAVLFRTNFQSRALEEAFLSAGIPYQVLGVKFFERKEVRDVLSYIRAALNPDALADIKRTINTPTRGIGKVTLAKVFAGERATLPDKARHAVDAYYDILLSISVQVGQTNVSGLLKFAIEKSGLEAMYKDEPDGEDRLENLRELVSIGTKYDHLETLAGIEKLLEEATLMSDQDTAEDARGVKLMTIHAAKGLEFAVVFITGLEQGLFPHERDRGARDADSEEERRLMYVALTRARHKLYLTYTSVRTIYGMRDIRLPSEFLSDIPEELITRESREGESGFGTVYLDD